jgi:hypothetical protein
MPPVEDPQLDQKLAQLIAMQAGGNNPRVAELLLIDWPAPDGPIYYGTRIAFDLLNKAELLARLDGPIELRLRAGMFLDVSHDAGISDDRVDLDFWDGDNEVTRLTQTHGAGMRVEVFYYFPDVDLLLSEWWGHWQPPDRVDIDRFRGGAESGFRSSNLTLPSRAFFTGCQAVFGGLLQTQEEIDEGDCPYNRHLGGVAAGEDPDYVNNANGTVGADGEYLKTSGGSDWNCGASHSQPVNAADDARIRVTVAGGYCAVGFFLTDSPRSGNADCQVCLQFNTADQSVTVKYGGSQSRPNAATWAVGNEFEIILRNGVFKFYKQGVEIVLSNWIPPAPVFPLFLGIAVQHEGAGVSTMAVALGDIGASPAFGLLDPDTDEPFTSCPRNNQAACIARLGDSKSYLAFDTVAESHVVHETKGPNITVTSRGNETNLKRPLRVIAGQRHVSELDLLAFVVEPNTNHPDQGSVKCLFANCEGPVQSATNGKINGSTIAPEHSNYRTGEKRQGQTSFSPGILNYSGTSLFLGVAQGDFTKSTADDLRGEIDIQGSKDVRVYSDADTWTEQYTAERGWWLLHMLRNKRWGYGLDPKRVRIEDFLDLAVWFKETVSVKDKDGNVFTGQRSTFNAELIDRTAQQQITDLCSSGRLGLPFPHRGKLRVIPLRRAADLFSAAVFTDKAFFGALGRAPTNLERSEWVDALNDARGLSPGALLLECQTRITGLFASTEYDDRDRTDEEFITDCHQAFLRRAPTAADLTFWLAELASSSRTAVVADFSTSAEFVAECSDANVPTFTDRGETRNVCIDRPQAEGGKSTLSYSMQSDKDLPNRIVLTFDDATRQNHQVPLTFEDVDQQLRAGRAFGDTSRRAVEREFTAFGVTDAGEAGRLGNLLLYLGEFDEGGLINNLRVQFTTWYLYTVNLHKYQIIKVTSDKLDFVNSIRVSQGLEPFTYFRIRSMRRLTDLKVEISAQAYPVEYYEQLEMLTQSPIQPPSGLPDFDPDDPDGPNGRFKTPFDVPLLSVGHNDDQIFFTVGVEQL